MLIYKKDLEVGDFYQEIREASGKADTIFVQLGLQYSRQYFRDDNGSYNMIEYLVGRVLNDLHKDKESHNCSSGGFKVEMFVDEEGWIQLEIYFDLT